jgi:hypothetical protein
MWCANYVTRALREKSPSHLTHGLLRMVPTITCQSLHIILTAPRTGQSSGCLRKPNLPLLHLRATTLEQTSLQSLLVYWSGMGFVKRWVLYLCHVQLLTISRWGGLLPIMQVTMIQLSESWRTT